MWVWYIYISGGIIYYAIHIMLLVECHERTMAGHIVMVTRGVMCDVGRSAPAGGLLIGAEGRGFPQRQRSLVVGGCLGGLESVRLGTLDEIYE